MAPPRAPQIRLPESRWVGKCFWRLPWALEKPRRCSPGQVTADRLPARSDSLPEVLREDAESLLRLDDPLALRLPESAASPGARVAPALGPVPDPSTDVLLVVEDSTHRG